jgi:hypothetical protein
VLVGLHEAGEHTSSELAALFGVARSTVYRALERHKARNRQAGAAGAETGAAVRRRAAAGGG